MHSRIGLMLIFLPVVEYRGGRICLQDLLMRTLSFLILIYLTYPCSTLTPLTRKGLCQAWRGMLIPYKRPTSLIHKIISVPGYTNAVIGPFESTVQYST